MSVSLPYSCRSIEAAASHEAKRVEQAAQGQLDRQKLQNEIQAEKERAKVSTGTGSCSICYHPQFVLRTNMVRDHGLYKYLQHTY